MLVSNHGNYQNYLYCKNCFLAILLGYLCDTEFELLQVFSIYTMYYYYCSYCIVRLIISCSFHTCYIPAGLSAPLVPQAMSSLSSVTALSPCFKLIGMFDPYR